MLLDTKDSAGTVLEGEAMKYSINPFKWLAWLWRRVNWRDSKWIAYHCPKPLSRKGKAALLREYQDELESRQKYVGIPKWFADVHKPYDSKESEE